MDNYTRRDHVTGLTRGSNDIALWALPFVLLLGAGIGFFNGVGIVVLGISPIIVTLAMNGICRVPRSV